MNKDQAIRAIQEFCSTKGYAIKSLFANEVVANRFWVYVVSSAFAGRTRQEIQDEIWGYLDQNHGKQAVDSISLVFALTPEEAKLSIPEVAA